MKLPCSLGRAQPRGAISNSAPYLSVSFERFEASWILFTIDSKPGMKLIFWYVLRLFINSEGTGGSDMGSSVRHAFDLSIQDRLLESQVELTDESYAKEWGPNIRYF